MNIDGATWARGSRSPDQRPSFTPGRVYAINGASREKNQDGKEFSFPPTVTFTSRYDPVKCQDGVGGYASTCASR
jgi:hypothetical protein